MYKTTVIRHIDIFTNEMIWCLGFVSNESGGEKKVIYKWNKTISEWLIIEAINMYIESFIKLVSLLLHMYAIFPKKKSQNFWELIEVRF